MAKEDQISITLHLDDDRPEYSLLAMCKPFQTYMGSEPVGKPWSEAHLYTDEQFQKFIQEDIAKIRKREKRKRGYKNDKY